MLDIAGCFSLEVLLLASPVGIWVGVRDPAVIAFMHVTT